MSAKRQILESLTRQRLIDLAYAFEADFGPTTLSKDELVDALARLRRTKLEELLPELSRDELKAACEALGLGSSGREKQVIIDRILGGSEGQAKPPERRKAEASAPQRRGRKPMADTKEKGDDQLSLPFRQAPSKLDVSALESWLWEAACQI